MKSENHQDIIKEMADRLRKHSVPYQKGAWERFREVEKKKPNGVLYWPYLSAAAVVLVAMVLFMKPSQNKTVVKELAIIETGNPRSYSEKTDEGEIKTKEAVEEGVEELQIKKVGERKEKVVLVSKAVAEHYVEKEEQTMLQAGDPMIILDGEQARSVVHVGSVQELDEVNEMKTGGIRTPVVVPKRMDNQQSVDFLAGLLSIDEQDGFTNNPKIDKKWSVGLEISPNLSANSQVNMGGGVAFAYSVSPKISFTSGVSYLQLDAERMPGGSSQVGSPQAGLPSLDSPILGPPDVANLSSNSRVKTLSKVEANLIGLDIPFAINYHINKKLYASAGVSVFNVLNEDRMNQFKNQVVDIAYSSEESRSPEPMVRTFYSTEAASEKLYEGKSMNGFFNFSVGYSVPVSKRIGISIEPFLKIPMGSLGEEEMNLRNGGIKIGTRF